MALFVSSSSSPIWSILAITGALIDHLSNEELSPINHVALTSILISLFSCSWAWSISIFDKTLGLFFAVKLTLANWLNTSGLVLGIYFMSWRKTGSQRE